MGLGDTLTKWLQDRADWLNAHNAFWHSWVLLGEKLEGAHVGNLLQDLADWLNAHNAFWHSWVLFHEEWSKTWLAHYIESVDAYSRVFERTHDTGKAEAARAARQSMTDANYRTYEERLLKDAPKTFDAKQMLKDAARTLGENKDLAEFQQIVGQILVEAVITPLEKTLDDGIENPRVFAQQFHGSLASLTMAGHIAGLAAEITSVGAIKQVGQFFTDLYFNFGLGFMGWQTISPLLDIGVKEAGGRYYNRRYRPRRWSISELMSLYALNEIGESVLREEMQSQGYRDQDIALAVRLSQQRVGVGDVLQSYSMGRMTATEALRRLREKGYRLEDAEFLIELEDAKNLDDQRAALVGVARTAYKKSLIDEARFRSTLASAGYAKDRIELEVSVANADKATDRKHLSVSQVESAYKEGVLGEPEARQYVRTYGIEEAAIPILIDTWNAELRPAPLRLNAGTISEAYQDLVIDRGVAKSKLLDLGWVEGDAEIILRIADDKIAARQKRTAEAAIRRVSTSDVREAFQTKTITEADARDLLRQLKLIPSDIDIIVKTWQVVPPTVPPTITQHTILIAYRLGVLDRGDALARLAQLGLGKEDISLLIQIADEQIAREQENAGGATARVITAGALRSAFMQGIIDDARVMGELGKLGFDAATGALLLATWQAEKGERPVVLSSAAIGNAYASGLIARSEASARLVSTGLASSDAELVLKVVERNFAERNPHPTAEAVLRNYAQGVILYDQAVKKLTDAGYDANRAAFLLRSYSLQPTVKVKQLTEAQVIKLAKIGVFDEVESVRRLKLLDYDDENAELVLIAALSELPKPGAEGG